jgi:hypothetical protein
VEIERWKIESDVDRSLLCETENLIAQHPKDRQRVQAIDGVATITRWHMTEPRLTAQNVNYLWLCRRTFHPPTVPRKLY